MEVLRCENLYIGTDENNVIVKDISLKVLKGEFISIIGESGSGKTLTSLALTGILPKNLKILSGSIFLNNVDITKNRNKIRNEKNISMVFQNSMSSLNPLMKIGPQVSEAITGNLGLNLKNNKEKVLNALKSVGLGRVDKIYDSYPHELSGGMRQRIGIAMALISNPQLLILDEPTTALDVTTQAQVLNLIGNLRKELNISVILISHDLSVVKENSQRIYIFYGGMVMEENNKDSIFRKPLHPYTEGLLKSVKSVQESNKPFFMVKGNLDRSLNGCLFHNRCPKVMDICKQIEPKYIKVNEGFVRCHLYDEEIFN